MVVHEPLYYTRFTINSLLQRLDTPAEPVYRYMKACFHAVTSFLLPDPLTGRNGTEEALELLTSGAAKPWSPLGALPQTVLGFFIALTPQRIWAYDLRCLQKVIWATQHPTYQQTEEFQVVVNEILAQSQLLDQFTLNRQCRK